MKVYTICGSMKFKNEMKKVSSELEAKQGICVLMPVNYSKKYKDNLQNLERISACQMRKIELCDAVYVMNVNGYIGESTKHEIAYAKSKGKQIVYHEKKKAGK